MHFDLDFDFDSGHNFDWHQRWCHRLSWMPSTAVAVAFVAVVVVTAAAAVVVAVAELSFADFAFVVVLVGLAVAYAERIERVVDSSPFDGRDDDVAPDLVPFDFAPTAATDNWDVERYCSLAWRPSVMFAVVYSQKMKRK